jgi:P4 family phage/plasmid primase-like protien
MANNNQDEVANLQCNKKLSLCNFNKMLEQNYENELHLNDGKVSKVWHAGYKLETEDDIWKGQASQGWAQMKYFSHTEMNHSDIASRCFGLSFLFRDNLVAFDSDDKRDYVYIFDDYSGIWRESLGKHAELVNQIELIRMKINNNIVKQMEKVMKLSMVKASNEEDKDMKEAYEKKAKAISKKLKLYTDLLMNLGKPCWQTGVINSIIVRVIMSTKWSEYKRSNFGTKAGYIGFTDGVYSFKTKGLIPNAEAKDLFITTTTGYAYEDVQNCVMDAEFVTFLCQIIPQEDLRKYLLSKWKNSLAGLIEKLIFIYYNDGNNGKSVLLNTLMKKTIGDAHFVKANNKMIYPEKYTNAGGSNEELMALQDKMFALISEPDNTKKLSMSLLKELSGGDDISGRKMYKGKQEFVFRGSIHIICNDIPSPDSNHAATYNRLRCIPFISTFTLNDDDVDHTKNVYKMNITIDQKFDVWKVMLMKCILDAEDVTTTPQIVIEHTKKLQQREDVLKRFISDVVEEKEGGVIHYMALWDEYKTWMREEGMFRDALKKSDFKDKIIKYFPANAFKERTTHQGRTVRDIFKGYRINMDKYIGVQDQGDDIDN